MNKARRMRRIVSMGVLLLLTSLAISLAAVSLWPSLGDKTTKKGSMTVDASFADDGYIQVKADSSRSLKLRISKDNKTYTYDLRNDNEYEVFPLQLGSGKYSVTLYEKVKGSKYSENAAVRVTADMSDPNSVYLYPSQYVYYTEDSPAVKAAAEICAGLSTDKEKIAAVRDYMVKGFTYDYIRALTINESYLGDVDGCFQTRMGLCQDLACVMAAMLRSQGIPTQLVIGYADKQYHAWNNVYVDGTFKRLDITALLGGVSSGRSYTTERIY